MIKLQSGKSKTSQYVVGGIAAVIILGLWISMPLMNGSSLDSSVSVGNPFRSKVADISSLGGDIPSEGGAPGSPLSGEMINNPATSGEDAASSLFQSGLFGEEPAAPGAAAETSASALSPAAPASSGAPRPSGPGARLSAVASITAGNSNSMTAGGVHNKFFGSGNQKAEFSQASGPDLNKIAAADKRSSLVAMLGNTAEKSKLALKTGNMDAVKGGAAEAFTNMAKAGASDLNGNLENQSASSGLQLGKTSQDLKRNDPSISKHKVSIPEPKTAVKDKKSEEEEWKKMIRQMIIQNLLGPMFGAMGNSLFGTTAAS
jgi:hypothetical protein